MATYEFKAFEFQLDEPFESYSHLFIGFFENGSLTHEINGFATYDFISKIYDPDPLNSNDFIGAFIDNAADRYSIQDRITATINLFETDDYYVFLSKVNAVNLVMDSINSLQLDYVNSPFNFTNSNSVFETVLRSLGFGFDASQLTLNAPGRKLLLDSDLVNTFAAISNLGIVSASTFKLTGTDGAPRLDGQENGGGGGIGLDHRIIEDTLTIILPEAVDDPGTTSDDTIGHIAGSDWSVEIVNVTGLFGSNFTEIIYGSSLDNSLIMLGGDDTVFGSLGNDYLDGDNGANTEHPPGLNDTLTYELLQDVQVTVAQIGGSPTVWQATKTDAAGTALSIDQFLNFEWLRLSPGADLIKLDSLPSDMDGMEFDGGDNSGARDFAIQHYAGNTIRTMSADADVLSLEGMGGAAGQPGVSVDLDNQDTGEPADGYLSFGTTTVSILNFEHVLGTDSDDAFLGSDVRNVLFGFAGDDILVGRGGEDLLVGDDGADVLYGGYWVDDATETPDPLNYADDGKTDILYGGAGNDTYYVSNNDLIWDMTLEASATTFDSEGIGSIYAPRQKVSNWASKC